MNKKIEITFEELKNRSMSLFASYSDMFHRSDNVIMLLAMYHEAFLIACHESTDQIKFIKGKKTLHIQVGDGKIGGLIDFEIVREKGKLAATEPLFDCLSFAADGFTFSDIVAMLNLSVTYQPKLQVEAVFNIKKQED